MNSRAEENYLKALLTLSYQHNGEVSVNDLSKLLGIKMPTVTSMMKKLSTKELVIYESYKPVRLTDQGRLEAALIIRKHRLTEMYLVEKMGFGWEEVHDIAEQIEHLDSPSFFAKMDELLNFPKFDPHGSPIPDADGKINPVTYVKLSDCHPNDQVIVSAVINSSEEFLKFLNSREIQLGLPLTIHSVEPFDGSMVVRFDKRKPETLSKIVTDRLLVERY